MAASPTPDLEASEALSEWLADHGLTASRVEPLTGDVSLRRYFRLELERGGTAVVAAYPPEMEDAYRRYLETTRWLAAAEVPVPGILARDARHRFMLLEDLGPRTLFELRLGTWRRWRPYLERAVELAGRIRRLERQRVEALNPPLDTAALLRELEPTWCHLLLPCGVAADPGLCRALEEALGAICGALGDAGLVPCHRDFMVRNLVPLPGAGDEHRLAVIDHQDLRLGPLGYDVASLLNDSLFPPPAQEAALLELSGVAEVDYRRAAVQRTLKAAGTFAVFAERGSPRHLPLIPPTLRRTLEHLQALPETRDLAPRLRAPWRRILAHGSRESAAAGQPGLC